MSFIGLESIASLAINCCNRRSIRASLEGGVLGERYFRARGLRSPMGLQPPATGKSCDRASSIPTPPPRSVTIHLLGCESRSRADRTAQPVAPPPVRDPDIDWRHGSPRAPTVSGARDTARK